MDLRRVRHKLSRAERRFDQVKLRAKRGLGLMSPLRVHPFRTWIAADGRLWLRGRVLEEKGMAAHDDASLWQNIRDSYNRYQSDEMPGARVQIQLGSRRHEVSCDEEGFFDVHFADTGDLPLRSPWTTVPLALVSPLVDGQAPHRVEACVRRLTDRARLGVISDMDDTVIRTGTNDLLKRLRVELFNNAYSREPFPHIGPFYRALSAGAINPFFYVSSSAWNIADLFERFLDIHDMPLGPILLKEMGLTGEYWLKSGHDEYKLRRIERILHAFPELQFILVGDSGQRDPFIYRRVVETFPGRVLAIYIRQMPDNAGEQDIRSAARDVADRGVDMLLMNDARYAAEHAADHGWISAAELDGVRIPA